MWDSDLGAVWTPDNKYSITSPSCNFVPEAFVGRVVVALRADYRYGPPDPIQWPQLLSPTWDYLCAIRRGVDSSDHRAVMWTNPPEDQFGVISGCEFTSLGVFKRGAMAHIEYFDLIKKTLKSKHTSPIPVRLDFIGAFTTLPHVVQNLFAAGIPVRFIRSDASVQGLHLMTGEAVQLSSLCTD